MKYMEQQKYDSAIIQFRKAIQIDPKYAEAHYQLAEADLKLQHNQEAFREMSSDGRTRSQQLQGPRRFGWNVPCLRFPLLP